MFALAKARGFALPAANCIGSSSMNAVMETAAKLNSPVIIQFSNGGGAFNAGKGLGSDIRASVLGSIAGAHHVRNLAQHYGARVVLHTDHAAKKLLPWIDGMLDAGEAYFEANGEPLYSSHMLDLSEEPIEENLDICVRYLERMSKMGMTLEIELGITGGEEDGVDNSDVKPEDLYSKPSEVAYAYERLSAVSDRFTIAAAFGNVHGVYKPGNVQLTPSILNDSQLHIQQTFDTGTNPSRFCVPRRLWFVCRRDRRGNLVRRREDEHRHRLAVGVLGWRSRLRSRELRLPPGPDRQPRRPRQAQ